MSSLVNQVQLIGRLGADAEFKVTNQGKKYVTFRLATNERVKQNNGEWKESTMWHNCVLWGDSNKVLENFGKKGNQIMAQGAIQYREYEDANAIKRIVTEIKVSHVMLLTSASSNVKKVDELLA